MPSNYKFVWLSNGASASEATIVFFKHCGVNCIPYWFEEKTKYAYDYNLLNTNKDGYNILAINPTLITEKYLSLLPKKTLFFHVLCDPISRLRVGINHLNNNETDASILSRVHSLQTPIQKLFPTLYYGFSTSSDKSKPDIAQLPQTFKIYSSFYPAFMQAMQCMTEFYCIDVEALGLQKAYVTFCDLAKKFDFPKLPSDEKLFQQRMNMFRGGLYALPFEITVPLCFGTNAIIKVAAYRHVEDGERLNNRAKELVGSEITIDNIDILLLVSEEDYINLKKDSLSFDLTKVYLQHYIKALESSIMYTKSYLYNEKDILQFLAQNKTYRDELYLLLQDEVKFFRENYQNFTLTWKYYEEFEKMCTENISSV